MQAYAASRVSSKLKGKTNKFGWLQAPATKSLFTPTALLSNDLVHLLVIAVGNVDYNLLGRHIQNLIRRIICAVRKTLEIY